MAPNLIIVLAWSAAVCVVLSLVALVNQHTERVWYTKWRLSITILLASWAMYITAFVRELPVSLAQLDVFQVLVICEVIVCPLIVVLCVIAENVPALRDTQPAGQELANVAVVFSVVTFIGSAACVMLT